MQEAQLRLAHADKVYASQLDKDLDDLWAAGEDLDGFVYDLRAKHIELSQTEGAAYTMLAARVVEDAVKALRNAEESLSKAYDRLDNWAA